MITVCRGMKEEIDIAQVWILLNFDKSLSEGEEEEGYAPLNDDIEDNLCWSWRIIW